MRFKWWVWSNVPVTIFKNLATMHLKLVDFTPQALVDHMTEGVSFSATVRAALRLTSLFVEPLVEARFTKVLTAAHG